MKFGESDSLVKCSFFRFKIQKAQEMGFLYFIKDNRLTFLYVNRIIIKRVQLNTFHHLVGLPIC
jgi:hypothetical protein